MPTISEAIREVYNLHKSQGVRAQDIRYLVMVNEGYKSPIEVLMAGNNPMSNEHLALLRFQVERLAKKEPVEYVVGRASFLGHSLKVNPSVLIPREETEELVALLSERVADFYEPRNYLVCADIGTGSGCIPIALKDSFPNWLLLASDIDKDALSVAQENFRDNGVQITTYLGDALDPYIDSKTNLDIIISNPPYILSKEDAQPSVRDYEPGKALWMEKGRSVYDKIFRDYKKIKRGSLLMIFEISPDLKDWLTTLMSSTLSDYEYSFHEDLNGLTRFLIVFLR